MGLPIFNTVKEAVHQVGAEVSIIFVPPAFAADSIMEASDAGIRYCVAVTDGIPTQDMMTVKSYLRRSPKEERMLLTGPNCAGTISPGRSMLGIMPGHIFSQGNVGIIGRSGTLGYEAADQMRILGIGISTSVGIGGDPITGSTYCDILEKFELDSETKMVVMIGEIGGTAEEDAAEFVNQSSVKKPMTGFIAGITAPPGKRMGHAGAIISGGQGTAEAKIEAMKSAGIHVADSPAALGSTMLKALNG